MEISFQLHVLLLFSSALSTPEQEIFRAFIEGHKTVCPVYDTCGGGPVPQQRPPRCCGYCSCEPDCEKLGNCCPVYYQSFSEGMVYVARAQKVIILDTYEGHLESS